MQPFFLRTFWQLRPFLILSALLLALGAALGFLAVGSLPDTTAVISREVISFLSIAKDWSQFGLFLFVLINNALKTLIMIYLGTAFGIVPASFLVINGLVLQVVAARGAEAVGGFVVAAALVPHGIIEIPALILGAALGLRLGLNLVRRLRRQQNRLSTSMGDAWRVYTRIIVPMLVVAAAIEVWITPQLIQLARQ